MSIPEWNTAGVIPPIRPGAEGHSPDRSPYPTTMTELVLCYSTTPERRAILDGLLRYRAALHAIGLTRGFQWVDGSFLEETEVLEDRAPNDVDVVTFFELPNGMAGQEGLLEAGAAIWRREKAEYRVDAYYEELGQPVGRSEVQRISYWYSLWSHRRDGIWKGFLQVDLDPQHDVEARANLDASAQEEGDA